jgi:acetyl-CoA carboxylase biotin carboxyl carrier protein
MDLKLIQRLVRLMKRADVTDLEIDDANAGMRVRLKRGGPDAVAAPVVQVMQGAGGAPLAPAAALVQPAAPAAGGGTPEAAPAPAGHAVTSPLVGTFYRSPSPDAAPFVEIGARIQVDQVLCIVEAMKVMNEIKSEVAGEVLDILVDNGEPVEYGQPLFLVKTS